MDKLHCYAILTLNGSVIDYVWALGTIEAEMMAAVLCPGVNYRLFVEVTKVAN